MRYRPLGNHGMRLSEIGLGAWITHDGTVPMEESIEIIHGAFDRGVNFIDTANVYAKGKAEEVVGMALRQSPLPRKDLVVSTKVFGRMSENPNDRGLSRKHIFDAIEASLERLGLDYVDLYYCHRFDRETPLDETVGAIADVISSGAVRYWGTSVWSAAQLEKVVGICREMGAPLPAVEQPKYHMFDRYIELDIMDVCTEYGIGITPYSPLAQGALTGKYVGGVPDDSRAKVKPDVLTRVENDIDKVPALIEIAAELEITMPQLALAYLLRRSEITSLITGATKMSQIEANVAASEIDLSAAMIEKIDTILDNTPEPHPNYA